LRSANPRQENQLELLTSRSAEYWALAFARFRDYIAFARSADPTLETDMPTTTDLPGIEAAREVLGLSLEEIARAVQTNPSTLYRWREGESTPNRSSQDRLKRLDELATEIDRALDPEQISYWLDAPASIFEGRSPREMVLEGRVETVLGALLSHGHVLRALEAAERGQTGFADLMARDDLSLATKGALALLDRQLEDLVWGMQTAEARAAAARAYGTKPSARMRAARERTL
jgi:transcriptional regulator with XRE-family HTH domain